MKSYCTSTVKFLSNSDPWCYAPRDDTCPGEGDQTFFVSVVFCRYTRTNLLSWEYVTIILAPCLIRVFKKKILFDTWQKKHIELNWIEFLPKEGGGQGGAVIVVDGDKIRLSKQQLKKTGNKGNDYFNIHIPSSIKGG